MEPRPRNGTGSQRNRQSQKDQKNKLNRFEIGLIQKKHRRRRGDVTGHYENNPNCFTDKRLAKYGDLEEIRAPEDATHI